MDYLLVQFVQAGLAYQEVLDGNVQRYTDMEGNTLNDFPPIADGCGVIDAAPPRRDWML